MGTSVKGLRSALALREREHLAFVGGGGKTSLMFALAGELLQVEKRVVTSTTTKVWHREALKSPCVIFTQSDPLWKEKLLEGIQRSGHVFLAHRLLESGKVEGISPTLANELYKDERIDYLVGEADGSAGRPVKAPGDHEPVIPSSVTKVIAILGLEALGKPMGPDVVFRMPLFQRITGLNPGQRLTSAVLSRIILDPRGLFKETPINAKRVVFLNKVDLLPDNRGARELADRILDHGSKQIECVVIGSIMKGAFESLKA